MVAFATSYIPTTGAAATRLADVASITGANFSSFWNQTEGTVVAAGQTNQGTNAYLAGVWGGDVNNRIALNYNSSERFFAGSRYLGTFAETQTANGAAPLSTLGKIAFAYATGQIASSWNGASVLTATPAGFPTWSRLDIGNNNGAATNWLNGHIQSLTYYNRRLPNQTLVSLTS
jgi:hypothetical protein